MRALLMLLIMFILGAFTGRMCWLLLTGFAQTYFIFKTTRNHFAHAR